jgi:hypothetical protein
MFLARTAPISKPPQGTAELNPAIYCWLRHLIKQKVRPTATALLDNVPDAPTA